MSVAFTEELVFRGYLVPSLKQVMPASAAVILSSAAFSLLHAKQSGFTVLVFINLTLRGVVCAALMERFRTIWSPIGVHLGWNWVQYHLFQLVPLPEYAREGFLLFEPGSPVVGTPAGAFGVEGSIFATALLALAVAGCVYMLRSARHGAGVTRAA